MIKLRELIKESAWDREFGEPLPTLSDVMEKHNDCDCGGKHECACETKDSVTEDVVDVRNGKKILQKISKTETKLRKLMFDLADVMESHTINLQLMRSLKKSYKSNITKFMRDVNSLVGKMK